MEKQHITTEILNFLECTNTTAAQLAREAGVSPVYISRLKNGKRKDIRSGYADKIRAAMMRFSDCPPSPSTEPDDAA